MELPNLGALRVSKPSECDARSKRHAAETAGLGKSWIHNHLTKNAEEAMKNTRDQNNWTLGWERTLNGFFATYSEGGDLSPTQMIQTMLTWMTRDWTQDEIMGAICAAAMECFSFVKKGRPRPLTESDRQSLRRLIDRNDANRTLYMRALRSQTTEDDLSQLATHLPRRLLSALQECERQWDIARQMTDYRADCRSLWDLLWSYRSTETERLNGPSILTMIKNICNMDGVQPRNANAVIAFLIYECLVEHVFRQRYTDPTQFDLGVRIPIGDAPYLFRDAPDPRQYTGGNKHGQNFNKKQPGYAALLDFLMGGRRKENNKIEVLGLKIDTIGIAPGQLYPEPMLLRDDYGFVTNAAVMKSAYEQRRGRDVRIHQYDETSFVHKLFHKLAQYEMHVTGYAQTTALARRAAAAPRAAAAQLGSNSRAGRVDSQKERNETARMQQQNAARASGGLTRLGRGQAGPSAPPPEPPAPPGTTPNEPTGPLWMSPWDRSMRRPSEDRDFDWLLDHGLGPLRAGHMPYWGNNPPPPDGEEDSSDDDEPLQERLERRTNAP